MTALTENIDTLINGYLAALVKLSCLEEALRAAEAELVEARLDLQNAEAERRANDFFAAPRLSATLERERKAAQALKKT